MIWYPVIKWSLLIGFWKRVHKSHKDEFSHYFSLGFILKMAKFSVFPIITSRVSGQGNRIGPVCVCMCVCLSICYSALIHSTKCHVASSRIFANNPYTIHHNKMTFGQTDCTMGGCERYVKAQVFSFKKRSTTYARYTHLFTHLDS